MKSILIVENARSRLRKAMKQKPVMAAVAFVSNVSGLPLGPGDTVACDASLKRALDGSTRRDALLQLVNQKVQVWSVENLHAKVVVAGKNAFIGSANWSANSARLSAFSAGSKAQQSTQKMSSCAM